MYKLISSILCLLFFHAGATIPHLEAFMEKALLSNKPGNTPINAKYIRENSGTLEPEQVYDVAPHTPQHEKSCLLSAACAIGNYNAVERFINQASPKTDFRQKIYQIPGYKRPLSLLEITLEGPDRSFSTLQDYQGTAQKMTPNQLLDRLKIIRLLHQKGLSVSEITDSTDYWYLSYPMEAIDDSNWDIDDKKSLYYECLRLGADITLKGRKNSGHFLKNTEVLDAMKNFYESGQAVTLAPNTRKKLFQQKLSSIMQYIKRRILLDHSDLFSTNNPSDADLFPEAVTERYKQLIWDAYPFLVERRAD